MNFLLSVLRRLGERILRDGCSILDLVRSVDIAGAGHATAAALYQRRGEEHDHHFTGRKGWRPSEEKSVVVLL